MSETSAMEQLLELTRSPGTALANWQDVLKLISAEFGQADTVEKRVSLLEMRHRLLAMVEATVSPDDLAALRQAAAKEYNSYIVQECLVGENLSVDDLDAVTQREVAAGRMLPDHSLRAHAAQAVLAPHLSREQLMDEDVQRALREPRPEPPPKRGFGALFSKILGR